MSKRMTARKAISYLEILFIVAIFAILGATVSPFLSSFVLSSNLNATSSRVLSTLRKAQSYSIDSKSNSVWGICVLGDKLRLYTSSCNSPVIREDFVVPGTVTITGLSDTTFSKLRGEPSNSLNIVISTNVESVSIQVNSAGGMTVL